MHAQIARTIEAEKVFLQQWGETLKAAGWNRKNLFSGLDPRTARTVGELPSLPVWIADGATVGEVNDRFIRLDTPEGPLFYNKNGGITVFEPRDN